MNVVHPMTDMAQPITPAERMALHLSEISRIQNNAGSILQFIALIFVISVYYFNALVLPSTAHRMMYASALALNTALVFFSCIQFYRCIAISINARTQSRSPLLSNQSEREVEDVLTTVANRYRSGATCFYFALFTSFGLLCLLAFGSITA